MEENKATHMDYIKQGMGQPWVTAVGLSPTPKRCLAPPSAAHGARVRGCAPTQHPPAQPMCLWECCIFLWGAMVPHSSQPHPCWCEGRGPSRWCHSKCLSLKAISPKASTAPAHEVWLILVFALLQLPLAFAILCWRKWDNSCFAGRPYSAMAQCILGEYCYSGDCCLEKQVSWYHREILWAFDVNW